MGNRALAVALIGAIGVAGSVAGDGRAGEPDAAQVQRAAEQYDEGSLALRASRFELAASHFEAAFEAAPSARALRNAMRARDAAGQAARAATLAALAERRYPDDAATVQLAGEMIARHEASLGRVAIRCGAPCLLAADRRAVIGGVGREHVIFSAPGSTKLLVSFQQGGDAERVVVVQAGSRISLAIDPPAPKSPGLGEPQALPEIVLAHRGKPLPAQPWYRSKALFLMSLGATGVLTGVTIWSGVDTLRDPGKDAVREACVGQGTDCPEYRRGVGKQVRTNALIGVSAGMGLATVLIAALLTDFRGRRPIDMSLSLSPLEQCLSFRGSW